MNLSTRILILVAALYLTLTPVQAQGLQEEANAVASKTPKPTNITLDGTFTDWTDKPSLTDRTGDEAAQNDLITVKWYPDRSDGNLYLYAERLGTNQHSNWDLTVNLEGDKGPVTLTVDYHVSSRQVDVQANDIRGKQLWTVKGKWGDEKDSGKKVEFYVPLTYLTDTTAGGYEIKMTVFSGMDKVPDNGFILISTASTFPLATAAILVALVFGYWALVKRRRFPLLRG